MSWRGVIEEFRSHLPLGPETEAVTLLEGNTPLLPATRLRAALELGPLWRGQTQRAAPPAAREVEPDGGG